MSNRSKLGMAVSKPIDTELLNNKWLFEYSQYYFSVQQMRVKKLGDSIEWVLV